MRGNVMFGFDQPNTLTQGSIYLHTTLHLVCLLMSISKVGKNQKILLATFPLHPVYAQNRIALSCGITQDHQTLCAACRTDKTCMPRVSLHANGLMTRSPVWGDSIKRIGTMSLPLPPVWGELKPASGPSEVQSPSALRNMLATWVMWAWCGCGSRLQTFCWIPRVQEHRGPISLPIGAFVGRRSSDA